MILLEFQTREELVEAARRLWGREARLVDAFTPYPVEELSQYFDAGPGRVSRNVFWGAFLGAATGFGMQTIATVLDYPFRVAGTPAFSWPAYLPVTFELGVLFGSFAAIGSVLLYCRLPRLHHPVFEVEAFRRASSESFFLLVEADLPLEVEGATLHALD
ncbi:MAG: DUF3341 domain-containing protein [Candidatus Eremiobacteraeota bacterium]|nr:DUF3341 domain-containing protein [Candidatus Eremiobacteraeota bacterium]